MPAVSNKNNVLTYKGSNFLRQRLLLATLSGKTVHITDIRSLDEEPGLNEFEVNLIRLLDKITNGSTVELNETGTSLYYSPGLLVGGTIHHDCSIQRGIGYYLEVLMCVGPFCKTPLNATLRGITNNAIDVSVDHIKAAGLSLLKRFLIVDDGLLLKINKRGARPLGGGEVIFKCPVRKQLRPLQFAEFGKVKRIRGTVYVTRMSPAFANRMVDKAKGVLLNFIPDVYINTDPCKGSEAGKSPGFGINLVAETTTGVFYSAEEVSNVISEGKEPSLPEDLGVSCASKLLDEIYRGGCVDSSYQYIAALFMALGQKDVSKIVIGPLSEYTISFLQHLREFFGITFKLEHLIDNEDDGESIQGAQKIVLTCVGVGYTNLSKRVL